MASPTLLRNAITRDFVCTRCAFRASKPQRRHIGVKYIQKVAVAEAEWQEKAETIRQGKTKSMLAILEERGLVNQIAGNRNALEELMTSKRIGAYVGIDPTASSLHIGHLLPLMTIFWLWAHGFHGVTLLGGATSKIGDPTDRLVSREQESGSVRTANMTTMHLQLKKIWANVEVYARKYGYSQDWAAKRELVNNNVWMNKLTLMEVLQILGPGLRMGAMLAKDTVKNKMEKGDGMSFAEFTYPILQAWDWWHMYNTKGVQLQIGGSDQYGNITAGMDAIKYISANHPDPDVRLGKHLPSAAPYGLTTPLLTTSSGQKFGKSAGNAIWLDPELTTTFELYGYFMKQSDVDVGRYLKLFTFMPMPEIEALMEEHMAAPHKRKAHKKLAFEFLELVHGTEVARSAESQHNMMFGKPTSMANLTGAALESASESTDPFNKAGKGNQPSVRNAPSPHMVLPRKLVLERSMPKIVRAAGLAPSNSEATRLMLIGSIYVGAEPSQFKSMNENALSWTPCKNWTIKENAAFLIKDDLLLLRRGKGNVRIIKLVDDDEWLKSGLTYPGYEDDHIFKNYEIEQKAVRASRRVIKPVEYGVVDGAGSPVEKS